MEIATQNRAITVFEDRALRVEMRKPLRRDNSARQGSVELQDGLFVDIPFGQSSSSGSYDFGSIDASPALSLKSRACVT